MRVYVIILMVCLHFPDCSSSNLQTLENREALVFSCGWRILGIKVHHYLLAQYHCLCILEALALALCILRLGALSIFLGVQSGISLVPVLFLPGLTVKRIAGFFNCKQRHYGWMKFDQCIFQYNLHFIFFPENSLSSVLRDLASYMGFGRRKWDSTLNRGGVFGPTMLHESDSGLPCCGCVFHTQLGKHKGIKDTCFGNVLTVVASTVFQITKFFFFF